MREVLIILSNSISDASMKESLLKFSFYDFAAELKKYLLDHYPHTNDMFANILDTFLYPSTADPQTISMERKEQNARMLLEKLVKIKDYFTTFHMIFQNLDLSLLAVTLDEMYKVTAEESISKLDRLSNMFPMIVGCMEFVDTTFALLKQLQYMWHPDQVKIFLAKYVWYQNNGIAGVKLFYGLTVNELEKYVKTPIAVESNSCNTYLEMIRDEMRLLLSAIYRLLGTLCKKQVFPFLLYLAELPMNSIHNQTVFTLHTWAKSMQEKFTDIHLNWTVYFEHTHFTVVVKHFMEAFYLTMPISNTNVNNTAAQNVTVWFAHRLAQFLKSATVRLTIAYDRNEALNIASDANVLALIQKEGGWTEIEEKRYCYLLYSRCFMMFQGINAEMTTIAQDSLISDIHRSITDMLSLIMGNRGPLKVVFPSSIPPETLSSLQKQLRRRFELHQVFFNIHIPEMLQQVGEMNKQSRVNTINDLKTAFLSCFSASLQFSDSTACRVTLALVSTLLLYSLQDTSLVTTLCREIFPQTLYILLKSVIVVGHLLFKIPIDLLFYYFRRSVGLWGWKWNVLNVCWIFIGLIS